MLTRLELSGFKSFADKTRLDFPRGISAIVGPNGSGKSNVVDAIRWVLGEQSAKSLRGDGMTDVIFNGSATRKAMTQAEVVLVLDNQAGLFPLSVPEVRIARRVNRQAESEYLINGKPCRLKDIRDLFLGSGAGSDSFCVIQQGQVHALLQASPKDRRSLFEEAAGISRFKSRRQEAHKRLENIDQHIARLVDILSEVEKQHQAANLQTSKAAKYRELRETIRLARVRLSWLEWNEIQKRLPVIEEALGKPDEILAQPKSMEGHEEKPDLFELEIEATALATQAEEARSKLEQVQKSLDGGFRSRAGLTRDLTDARERFARLIIRWRDGKTWLETTELEINLAEQDLADLQPKLSASEENDNLFRQNLSGLREQADTNRSRQLESLRRQNEISGQFSTQNNSLEQVIAAHDRLKATKEQQVADLDRLRQLVTKLETEEAKGQIAASVSMAELETARQNKETKSRQLIQTRIQNQKLLVERGEIRSRLEVLEQLELSQEGLAPGVRTVLELKKNSKNRAWNGVIGLVADSLRVRREYAHLVEIALGDFSQRFLAENKTQVLAALGKESQNLQGRVGFIFPSENFNLEDDSILPSGDHHGLVARASNLISCEHPKFIGLPDRLLGKTLIVKNLESAFQLASKLQSFRFITLSGEMIDEFGSIVLGKLPVEGGVLSRKNEVKDLRESLAQVESDLGENEIQLAREKRQLDTLEAGLATLELKTRDLTQLASDLAGKLDRERISLDSANQEQLAGQQEERRLETEIKRLRIEVQEIKNLLESSEKATSGFQSVLDRINIQIEEVAKKETNARTETEKLQACANQINLKIQILKRQKSEKMIQIESIGEDLAREQRNLKERESQLAHLDQILLTTAMNQTTSQISWAVIREAKRKAENSLSVNRQKLEKLAQDTSSQLNEINQRQANFSSMEKERQRYMVRIEQIQDRLREEEITDINQIQPDATWLAEPFSRDSDLNTIKELQIQLQRLGSVNHDSARELLLLGERKEMLHDQLSDLQGARKNLLESLENLNLIATKKFVECFSAIQEHFRDLFRKIFGGGTAELSLEDPVYPLDTGIEVLARPPGKDAARLSLMSGGERTMTAVALLLAVFKSRPGPFCLMDEVDAALDEANVDRFAGVLKEFSEKTQFILISHHKRTMASATVLHGITMKEPGISTRYSVDVEDYMSQKGKSNDSGPLAA